MFEYREQARNAFTFTLLGCAAAILVAALFLQGSVLLIAAIAFGIACLGVRLALNPSRGFRMSGRTLELFQPGMYRILPLKQVDSVMISGRRAGETLCFIRMADGSELPVPATERLAPRELAAGFSAGGLRVLI